MSTIWLDVTTTLSWQRPAVGVVRVEAECAKSALSGKAGNLPIRFCAFNRDTGFFEIAAADLKGALERIDGVEHAKPNSPQTPGSPASAPQKAPLVERLKQLTLRLCSRLPSRYSSRLLHFAMSRKAGILEMIHGLRLIKHALQSLALSLIRRRAQPAPQQAIVQPVTALARAEPPFKAGDVYISLGLDWNDKDLPQLRQLKRKLGLRVLLCCYDVIPVKAPQLCAGDVAPFFSNYFSNLAEAADKVVCISRCSERDLLGLLDTLGAPVPETSVITLGSDLPRPVKKQPEIDRPYILFVSTIERRKNHEVLYRAYTRLLDAGVTDLPLMVFVGMSGWGISELLNDLRLDERIKGHIEMRTNVTDEELNGLYGNALFTVYPSLYEGWGLPVAESLAHGKFCLSSDAASLPEVGGEFVEYLDPLSVPAWAERILFYARHPEELARKEQVIATRYVAPSWSDTARSIFDKAHELANQSAPTSESRNPSQKAPEHHQ
ncbi:glycosyltransferase family 4 protein [Pseudomonas sp. ZM23]|uniref:Glycosyltransferase family 1 protein n=1 Tax=Pseudomonas triclosanedens TaxID=2961893 RepID=A0ABY6ZWS7_9PSED|nr:glycosyltransferase family 1 protein [Pseudomonas triclosanedens]MCP8467866.1 glycosyltransferase family 4 protein [Pseudomonas triclosanedens]MCP8469967.1 glycosyltransferase family 4 protein [Pseudomonas triclosanedens]MCP8477877.1 glycosyltransferase family 4 protein [Pseudomonas triclosanedens]WAI49298.1 glycosyltransferase family 1 protein [Pseudomonas triclosanedens]